MRSFALLCLAVVVLATVLEVANACDCDYHPGGCVISKAAAAGNKCKCRYKGAWTCDGLELQCLSSESCPADCRNQECCRVGGGDCGGYSR